MKKQISNIVLSIILLVGVSLLLYPTVSAYINSRHQARLVEDYTAKVQNIEEDYAEEMIRKAKEYNEQLAGTEGAFYNPDLVAGYTDILDVTGTGVMGYVTIGKIGVELPIYHTVEENILQIAAGHLPGSSFPVPGENVHAVISGHRGLPSSLLFTDLDKLEVGDIFQITVLKEVYTYEIDKITIVLPNEVKDLQLEKGKEYCTLMTCTPYGVNSHRLLVRGKRIETVKEGDPLYVTNEASQVDPLLVMPIVAAPLLLILLIITIVFHRNKKQREEILEKGMEVHETDEKDQT